MPLASNQQDLIDQHLGDTEVISALIFGLCWNDSALASAAKSTSMRTRRLSRLLRVTISAGTRLDLKTPDTLHPIPLARL